MGFSGKCSLPENVLNAYTNEEIGLLPRGGVALLLEHVAADDKNVKFNKEQGRHFPENPIRRTINHFECSPQLFLTVKV
jgi:hypothetical protein